MGLATHGFGQEISAAGGSSCPLLHLPSSVFESIWDRFHCLIPPVVDTHPLGCHRSRVGERIVVDTLIRILTWGIPHEGIADESCSVTTITRRRDEWIQAGIFQDLEDLCLEAADKMLGLQGEDFAVDGCIVKAPCGGEAAGQSPVDRGRQGTKRSLMIESQGLPIEFVIAGANRPDSPLLEETPQQLARFGFDLLQRIRCPLLRVPDAALAGGVWRARGGVDGGSWSRLSDVRASGGRLPEFIGHGDLWQQVIEDEAQNDRGDDHDDECRGQGVVEQPQRGERSDHQYANAEKRSEPSASLGPGRGVGGICRWDHAVSPLPDVEDGVNDDAEGVQCDAAVG